MKTCLRAKAISAMHVSAITTRTLTPPQDDLFAVIDDAISDLADGDILCVTSKVLAIHQGRCVALDPAIEKDSLVLTESDYALPREHVPGKHALHTITDGNLAVSAGIDESNGHGHYILWPKNPSAAAREIRAYLLKKFDLTDLGIIITDSRSLPLRYGAIGTAIGAHGFAPLRDYTGTQDLFTRKLAFEQSNLADGLAAAAVLTMGEGDESKPLCIIKNAPNITFSEEANFENLKVPLGKDIYYPFLKIFENNKKSL